MKSHKINQGIRFNKNGITLELILRDFEGTKRHRSAIIEVKNIYLNKIFKLNPLEILEISFYKLEIFIPSGIYSSSNKVPFVYKLNKRCKYSDI